MIDTLAQRHTCAICGGIYHATAESERSHRAVNGHRPRPRPQTVDEPTR